jgi:methyl-accepting chemotaxis protein
MFFSKKPAKQDVNQLSAESDNPVLDSIYKNLAIAEFSPEGDILFANESYLAMVGYSEHDLIGKPHKSLCLSKDVSSEAYGEFWRQLRNGQSSNGQFRRKHKDGSTIWLDASYAPVMHASGGVDKIVKIAHDITAIMAENKRNEDTRRAIDLSMAVIEFDTNIIVKTANQHFLNATGYSNVDEIKGKHHRIFCEEEYAQSPEYERFWADLAQGKSISDRFKRKKKDGSTVWLEASYAPLKSSDGEIHGFIKFAADITENIEKNLRESESAQSAYHITTKTEQTAAEGTEVVQEAAREMAKITEAVAVTAAQIAELGQQSEEITSIVNTIRGIADQTNLLALNAAIEAARAGEQGRGFAVVADEVRQLAARTSTSTEEISSMINKMQSGTANAITSMNTCQSQAEHGMDLANKAGEVILEIRAGTKDAVNSVSIFADGLR